MINFNLKKLLSQFMEIITSSEKETQLLARKMAKNIKKNQNGAFVIALSGDLGSGKTIFSKGLLEVFGINQNDVTSPTFVIMKRYQSDKEFSDIYHIDLYRLEDKTDLKEINFKEIVKEKNNLVLIEWPERLKKAPKNCLYINFEVLGEKRKIEIPKELLLE